MKKEQEPGTLRIIEMHLTLDEQGKVLVPRDLMEALGIQPGDMLSFYFGDEGVTVKGGKKPPYVHAATIAPARGSHQPSPAQPLLAPSADLLQMPLFGDTPPQKLLPTRRRRTNLK